MKLQSLLLLIVLAVIAAFSALNWGVFITPTALSLGITEVQMPLGLVMLGLLDQGEASRFTELRTFLDAELTKQNNLQAESRTTVIARIDQQELDLRTAIENSGNTLAAYIGELEDRLEKTGASTVRS